MTRSDALVELNDAGVSRAGRWLVRSVSMVVRPGEIVTLIGPNGSGKSTTARLALGIARPNEGSVSRRAGLKASYVPQKVAIDWTLPLTVNGLMSLTQNISTGEMHKALDSTGAAHLLGRDVRHLSGGEFQRVMLARALARKPDLLVLDEPTQGVDFAGELALYDLVQQVRNTLGCGILLISHDLHMVMAGTDHVLCLNGHVCCQGTPELVASSAAFKDLFGQRGSGLALYQHHHDHTHLADGRVQHSDGSISDHCHPGDGHHHAPGRSDGHDFSQDYVGPAARGSDRHAG